MSDRASFITDLNRLLIKQAVDMIKVKDYENYITLQRIHIRGFLQSRLPVKGLLPARIDDYKVPSGLADYVILYSQYSHLSHHIHHRYDMTPKYSSARRTSRAGIVQPDIILHDRVVLSKVRRMGPGTLPRTSAWVN